MNNLEENFITQCIMAEEIQASKTCIERGDLWCWKSSPKEIYLHSKDHPMVIVRKNAEDKRNRKIWLPSQHQLQEMLHSRSLILLIAGFSAFCQLAARFKPQPSEWDEKMETVRIEIGAPLNKEELKYPQQFTSMEELWLAFVMWVLYHKKWYNGAWRLENGRDKTDSEKDRL